MLDLLDCLMPACHEASAVTTATAAGVTFATVVAVAALAVPGHRLACPMGPGAGASRRQVPLLTSPGAVRQGKEPGVRRQSRDSCSACFKADLAAQGKRIGARRGAFPGVIVEPSALVAALSPHRAFARAG
jgi:hypothetical protein